MAPSAAIVNAGPTRERTSAREMEGSDGAGNVRSIEPNRLPIVSTGRWNNFAAAAVTTSATTAPGTRHAKRRQMMSSTSVNVAIAVAHGFTELAAVASTRSFSMN